MAGERRGWIAIALVVVAALYLAKVKLGCGAPNPMEAPEPPIEERQVASDEPPLADASARPARRPPGQLFLFAKVTRAPEDDACALMRAAPGEGTAPEGRARTEWGSATGGPTRERLRELGFVDDGPRQERLRELGLLVDGQARAFTFDARIGDPANRHDALLRTLAALAGSALEGAEFVELRSAWPGADYAIRVCPAVHRVRGAAKEAASPPPVLRATALNFGSWYDLDAVLGLLNVALEDRGSSLRFVPLVTQDRWVTVLVGPQQGIEAAAAQGLIEVGEASFAMNTGWLEEAAPPAPASQSE